MNQILASRTPIGHYGLYAFAAVVLLLFVAFLWVFNFTTFF